MLTIKFSHRYFKLPDVDKAILLHVFVDDFSNIKPEFYDYDTAFKSPTSFLTAHYELPKEGKCIVLLFEAGGRAFTTIRRHTPEKYEYYHSNVGKSFQIVRLWEDE